MLAVALTKFVIVSTNIRIGVAIRLKIERTVKTLALLRFYGPYIAEYDAKMMRDETIVSIFIKT